MTSANKQDTTSSTFRCAWICRARRFSETCQRLCPLECRDGAAMSEHCHQRRTRQLCRLPHQATSPVAAAANACPFGHGETLGNLRSCKSHRRAAAFCIRGMSTALARARQSLRRHPPEAGDQNSHGWIRRRGSARGWIIKPASRPSSTRQSGLRKGAPSPEPSRVVSSLYVEGGPRPSQK